MIIAGFMHYMVLSIEYKHIEIKVITELLFYLLNNRNYPYYTITELREQPLARSTESNTISKENDGNNVWLVW